MGAKTVSKGGIKGKETRIQKIVCDRDTFATTRYRCSSQIPLPVSLSRIIGEFEWEMLPWIEIKPDMSINHSGRRLKISRIARLSTTILNKRKSSPPGCKSSLLLALR